MEKFTSDENTIKRLFLAVENKQNILLHGLGGCGKTKCLKDIASHFILKGSVVACTATTGIAAVGLSVPEKRISGSTLHSWAGVKLGDKPPQRLVAEVNNNDPAKKRWLDTDILIIDEVSMLSAEFIDKLDYVGRSVRRTPDSPFGGLQIIFSGDFLQLPPVKAKWVFESIVWKEMATATENTSALQSFILEEPKRYNDLDWFHKLMRFRKAQHTPEDVKFLHSRVKAYETWLASPAAKDLTSVKPTMLYSKNVDVEFQNETELRKLPSFPIEFLAVDTFTKYNGYAKRDDYIRPLEDAIPTCISLNVGAQVMLKANLDIKAGLANGSRGVISAILGSLEAGVQVKWLNGKTTTVTMHTWLREDKDGKASRTQIPLILAWAYSIHKAQGCTLDYAICDLGPSIWLPGQAYVALSRVRSSAGLFLIEFYPPGIKAEPLALAYVEKIEKESREGVTSKTVERKVAVPKKKLNIKIIYDPEPLH